MAGVPAAGAGSSSGLATRILEDIVAPRDDDDDLFDGVIRLEETLAQHGHAMGSAAGQAAGLEEGRELGVIKGQELGLELGYYSGCAALVAALPPDAVPERAVKTAEALGALVVGFRVDDPLDEDLLDNLQRIRAKFRVLAAVSKLPGLEDNVPGPKPTVGGVYF